MGGAAGSDYILKSNGLETAYLSSVAFNVGRQSLFDRHVLKLVPSTWWLVFWRFFEGAAASSFFLHM